MKKSITKAPILFSIAFLVIITSTWTGPLVFRRAHFDAPVTKPWELIADWLVWPISTASPIRTCVDEIRGDLDSLESLRRRSLVVDLCAAKTRPDELKILEEVVSDRVLKLNDLMRPPLSFGRTWTGRDLVKSILDTLDLIRETGSACNAFWMDGKIDFLRKGTDSALTLIAPRNFLFWPSVWVRSFRRTLGSREYMTEYLCDALSSISYPKANRWIRHLRFVLLGDTGENFVLGRDGWAFFKPGIDFLTYPYVQSPGSRFVVIRGKRYNDDPLRAIETFKNQLKKLGVDLLVVVVPDKARIYPEMVWGNGEWNGSTLAKVDTYRQFLSDLNSAGVKTLDLCTIFTEEKNAEQNGEPLYLKRDTHWSPRGISIAAKAIAAEIRGYSWYSDHHETTPIEVDTVPMVERHGDIDQMLSAAWPTVKGFSLRGAPEVVSCLQVRLPSYDSIASSKYGPWRKEYRDSRILLIGDAHSGVYEVEEPVNAGLPSQIIRELSEPVGTIISYGGAGTLALLTFTRRRRALRTL